MSTPTSDPGVETPARRGDARTAAILDAALELVAELGYERVTVDSIAARAHASKTTMYRRWPTKAQLVADALRRHAQGDAPIAPDTGSLRGDLLATVAQIARSLTGEDGPSLIGLIEAIRDDEPLRGQVTTQVRERSHQVGRAICVHAVARGEVIRGTGIDEVFDLAFDHLFAATLFGGAPPNDSRQRSFVDDLLLPLLTATS